jgi:hypothetical protein
LTWINVLATVRTDNEPTSILQGADAMQLSLASGTVMWIRKHMRVVVQAGISLIAAAIMMAAALDVVAAQDSVKRETNQYV